MAQARFFTPVAAALASLLVAANAQAVVLLQATLASQDTIRGQSQDTSVNPLEYLVGTGSGVAGISGSSGTRAGTLPVIGFELPVIGPADIINSVTLTYNIRLGRDSSGGINTNNASLDAYLLNSANPSATGIGFYYHGSSGAETNPSTAFLGGLNPTTTLSATGDTLVNESISLVLAGDALETFKSFYTSGIPNQPEAFFRFNLSAFPSLTVIDRMTLDLVEQLPMLELNVTQVIIPEPSALALCLLAGLLAFGGRWNQRARAFTR